MVIDVLVNLVCTAVMAPKGRHHPKVHRFIHVNVGSDRNGQVQEDEDRGDYLVGRIDHAVQFTSTR